VRSAARRDGRRDPGACQPGTVHPQGCPVRRARAAEVDAATERIIEYLAKGYGVPVNVVFFRYFLDGSGNT